MTPKPQENNSGVPLTRALQNSNLSGGSCGVIDGGTGINGGFVNQGFENEKNSEKSASAAAAGGKHQQQEETKLTDFDDFLPHLGEFGKYQKILFICTLPFAFFIAFLYFSQIFMTAVPDGHWCFVPELENLTVEERMSLSIPLDENGEYNKCAMYDVNYTEILANGTNKADPSWPKVACRSGWEFNYTEIPYSTVATELEWVCDNAALPTIAQSLFFVGSIMGGLLFGFVADRFGRIPALVGCNLFGFVAGIATAFVQSFWQFAFCRFLVGFAFDNCFTMIYILALEYVGPKWRTFVANMSIAIFFTLGSCALPWIAYYIANWKIFAIVTSAPLAFAIFTPLIVPESARWLVSQGKIEKAITILKKFEKVNKKTIPPQVYKDFSDSCTQMLQEEESHKTYSVLDLFKTPRLRKVTIILILMWMSIALVFDGHVRNVGYLGLDLFITFTVASATEMPADTLLTLTLDHWGRRWLACGSMVLSGAFSLLATMVPLGIYYATLAMMGRFCINITYNIGLQYAAELLPTVVRAQGVAFIHIMGYVASILAPFIVYLQVVSPSLPLIILGLIGIVGGLISLMLPETLGHDLPQTLNDGEEFGRGQKFWEFPCCGNKPEPEEDTIEKGKKSPFERSAAKASLRSINGEIRSSLLRRSFRTNKISA